MFLKGPEAHASHAVTLNRLRCATGQDGNISTDPLGFATSSVDWGRRPWTILLKEDGQPVGAVLLREVVQSRIPTGYFFASDAVGEEFVLAPAAERESIFRRCIEALVQRKPSAVIFLGTQADQSHLGWKELKYGAGKGEVRYRLPIRGTVAETLREIGTHTRKNLRYYATSALRAGMVFYPSLRPEQMQDAVASLYPKCDYSISERGLAAILNAMGRLEGGFSSGLRSATGEWLSVAMGWREGGTTNVFFLMHHTGYRKASLSTTLRSFMVTHEVERGSRELIVVGGANAVVGRGCVPDIRHDLLLGRPGWRLALTIWIGRRLSPKHRLRQFLDRLSVERQGVEIRIATRVDQRSGT
ncbi:hypothetical protein SAMN05421770_1055 [Granulicella rosea]|uniref:Acetyltransferase (GNAT) domain-containing protein n=1 Tax=Granulicella rosea TaxID=474952 RepID=A0A239KKT4_9BACT|nr:hypothetical protein [Granulicella rosea]SNT18312.1 hypothetical protein SAMN05421770_1055 [Granulicella rosea]